MNQDKAVEIAIELQKLGVSQAGVTELLSGYPFDQIERQLAYLPYRKAKRPEAFIIEAVRNNYSPPKEFFYAQTAAQTKPLSNPLDQNPEPALRQAPSEPQGHGAEAPSSLDPSELRLEPGEQTCQLAVPPIETDDRQAQ